MLDTRFVTLWDRAKRTIKSRETPPHNAAPSAAQSSVRADAPATAQGVTLNHIDKVNSDERAAMKLRELIQIEFFNQRLDRFADESFARRGDQAGVFAVLLKEQHLVDGDKKHSVAKALLAPNAAAAPELRPRG